MAIKQLQQKNGVIVGYIYSIGKNVATRGTNYAKNVDSVPEKKVHIQQNCLYGKVSYGLMAIVGFGYVLQVATKTML